MTTNKITYQDKNESAPKGTDTRRARAIDMNEIKTVVNEHAEAIDGVKSGNIVIYPPTQDSAHALEAAAEINAVIIANPGRRIKIREGRYLINQTIKLNHDASGLVGEGMPYPFIDKTLPRAWNTPTGFEWPDLGGGVKLILVTPDIDIIEVAPPYEGQASVPQLRNEQIGNVVRDLTLDVHPDISHLLTDKYKAGLSLKQIRHASFENLHISNAALAILVSGVQASYFKDMRLFANMQTPYLGEDSTLLRIQQHVIAGGSVNCWENRYTNIVCSAPTGTRESVLKILRGDGEVFSGCYVNGGRLANIIIETDDRSGARQSIGNVRFLGHRFDSTGSNSPYRYQLLIRGTVSGINNIRFDSSCQWNSNSGMTTNNVHIDTNIVGHVHISGSFNNIRNSIVRAKASADNTIISVSDLRIRNHHNIPISGTVTSFEGGVITDSSKTWIEDQLANRWFIANSERIRILSNTETSITLASAPTIGVSDEYTIKAAALFDIEDVKGLNISSVINSMPEDNPLSVIELNGSIKHLNINGCDNMTNIPDVIDNALIEKFEITGNTSVFDGDKVNSWKNKFINFTPVVQFGVQGSTPPTFSTLTGYCTYANGIANIRITCIFSSLGNSEGLVRLINIPYPPYLATPLAFTNNALIDSNIRLFATVNIVGGVTRIEFLKGDGNNLRYEDLTNTTRLTVSGSYLVK